LVKGQYKAVHESSTKNVTNVQEIFARYLQLHPSTNLVIQEMATWWCPGVVLWKPFLQRTLSYDATVRKSGEVHLTEQDQYLKLVGVG
jgi:hypothetical protein